MYCLIDKKRAHAALILQILGNFDPLSDRFHNTLLTEMKTGGVCNKNTDVSMCVIEFGQIQIAHLSIIDVSFPQLSGKKLV